MIKLFILSSALLITTPTIAKPDTVISVHDGDTFRIEGEWAIVSGRKILHRIPGPVNIRILGIDTPEIGAGAKCPAEKEAAIKARDNLAVLIAANGGKVNNPKITQDKYGRALSEPFAKGSLSAAQINSGFAKPYTGQGPKTDWCAILGDKEIEQ